MTPADTGLATSGLWRRLLPDEAAGFEAWADEQYALDPEQPIKRVWHPVARRRFGELILAQADAELAVMTARALWGEER